MKLLISKYLLFLLISKNLLLLFDNDSFKFPKDFEFFKEEHIKYRNKRRLITQERYHNLFKEYYLKSNRNNSKDSLNKQTKNIPKCGGCKTSVAFKK